MKNISIPLGFLSFLIYYSLNLYFNSWHHIHSDDLELQKDLHQAPPNFRQLLNKFRRYHLDLLPLHSNVSLTELEELDLREHHVELDDLFLQQP